MKYVEFMKKVVPLHDDLFDFFYEALPGYEEVGRRRVLLGCWGSFNDPDGLRLHTIDNMDEWGKAMYVTPGVVVDGKAGDEQPRRHQPGHPHPARQLVLRRLGAGRDVRQRTTRSATPSTVAIPGTRRPRPGPQKRDFEGNYTWVMSPRW